MSSSKRVSELSGKELDRAVTVEVMGWTGNVVNWRPSTDIGHAMRADERMRAMHDKHYNHIQARGELLSVRQDFARIFRWTYYDGPLPQAVTGQSFTMLSEAISRAAVAAVRAINSGNAAGGE